jgi:hypothetical protein
MIFKRGHFRSSRISKAVLAESLNEARKFNATSIYRAKTTVFLSHKHDDLQDEKEVRGVIEFLEDMGIKVYVDSMDNRMPKETSGETAKRIKEIIKFCDKFILLATDKAIESYWCNWELGIGDVHKYINNIAILPIKNEEQYDFQYKGNEYLSIYPRIDYEDGTGRYESDERITKGYYYSKPRDENGTKVITPIETWLKR